MLQSMMERTERRLANDETLGVTVRKQYEKLASWIKSMTLKQLLDWFDCVERVEGRTGWLSTAGQRRRPPETSCSWSSSLINLLECVSDGFQVHMEKFASLRYP